MKPKKKPIAGHNFHYECRQAAVALKMTDSNSGGRRQAASRFVWPPLRVLFLLTAALTFSVSACRKPADSAQGVSIQESMAPLPVHTGEETVSIRLADTAGHPVTRARVQIEGDMNHPGMAPVFSDAEETAPGAYTAPLTFTMGGDWAVLAHIVLADGRKIERQWDVKGVESR
jgi:hypothetical protein